MDAHMIAFFLGTGWCILPGVGWEFRVWGFEVRVQDIGFRV